MASVPTETPAGLWEGCAQVAEFDELEHIRFNTGEIEAGTASYPVETLQGGKMFDYKYLKRIIPYVKTIDLTTYADRAFFFGDKVRGIVVGIKEGNGDE